MIKKFYKISGIIFAIATMLSLILPTFYTYIDGDVGAHITLRVYNMAEFSPWGSIAIFMPLILLGVMCGKFNNNTKMLLVMSMFLLEAASIYNGAWSAHQWIKECATGFVESYGTVIAFEGCYILASLCFYLHCYELQQSDNKITPNKIKCQKKGGQICF